MFPMQGAVDCNYYPAGQLSTSGPDRNAPLPECTSRNAPNFVVGMLQPLGRYAALIWLQSNICILKI